MDSFFQLFKIRSYIFNSKYPEEITTLINDYIYLYNHERVQIKNGMSPVKYRTHTS
ncbi:IS3 family transposase [Paraclostridium sordellii]|uniref:IS3 family transposase n=1 Tax=Paraclostridium sordellii TaxID=1505 RepID=UPI003A8C45B3